MQQDQKQHTDFQGLKSRLFLVIDFLADAEAFCLNPDSCSKGLQELCPVARLLGSDDGICSAPCDTAENQWNELEHPFCSGHPTPYGVTNHEIPPQYPSFFEMQPETNGCGYQAQRNLPGIAEILNAEPQHWVGQSNVCQHDMVLEGSGTPFCLSNPTVERTLCPLNEMAKLQSERFGQTLEISNNPSFVNCPCEIVFGAEPPGRIPPGPQIKLEQQDFAQRQLYNRAPRNYQRFLVNRAQEPQYQNPVFGLQPNEAAIPTPMPTHSRCFTAYNYVNPHRHPSQI
ncbi:hypothetical protein TWF788_004666 [Orbilia oligospora]|uniref:Uncharacterized protein n=1 Tax=Orbilia oligospora TaxID=2813651 RepID=A0A7C8TYH7_ORBOL|nr:hypothetical protein TWF788_004666 [Orbilia oligospora]